MSIMLADFGRYSFQVAKILSHLLKMDGIDILAQAASGSSLTFFSTQVS